MLTFRNKTIYGSVELSEDKGDYRLETVESTEEEFNVLWAQLDYEDWEDESEVLEGLEPDQPEVEQERASSLVARGEEDTETVVCALFHDVGELLSPVCHGEIGQ